MLEHPFRFVNEFINHDDSEDDELGRMEGAGSHDQATAKPPPSADGVAGDGDTPTSECTAGDECGSDEGVKIADMRQSLEDLASATPLENK